MINNSSSQPTVPQIGQLDQIRLQGVDEVTHHELKVFGKIGYSAQLHHVALTNGHGGWIKPTYGYEHDYKLTNNGYVETTANYDWSTNLPGAYRDTRASDSSTILDFTIGSLYTWLLDAHTTYVIDTEVSANTTRTSTTARLTAQVLPNDGSFSKVTAAAGTGCKFTVDPSNPALVPQDASGDYAWCTGIGHGLGSQKAAYSYISLTPFTIKYSGTCRNWTLGLGAKNC